MEDIIATGKYVYCGEVCNIKVVPTYWAGITTGNFQAMVEKDGNWYDLQWLANTEQMLDWIRTNCMDTEYLDKDWIRGKNV